MNKPLQGTVPPDPNQQKASRLKFPSQIQGQLGLGAVARRSLLGHCSRVPGSRWWVVKVELSPFLDSGRKDRRGSQAVGKSIPRHRV